MKEVKYRDIKVGEHLFTIKLIYIVGGGFYYENIVKIRIMEYHPIPQTFSEKFLEYLRYPVYDTREYSTLETDMELKEWCEKWCEAIAKKQDSLMKAEKEWNKI